MAGSTVPFGKYRGRPVEELAIDRDYCDWLMAQPWFADRYRDVYNIVINYGGEPQDSPEHNRLQALLLSDNFCVALANLVREPSPVGAYSNSNKSIFDRSFERNGWDCVFAVSNGRYEEWAYFNIECKPSIGEDYPSVLRQAKGYLRNPFSNRVVLADVLTFRSVPDGDVRRIFQSSGVTLVTVGEVRQLMAAADG